MAAINNKTAIAAEDSVYDADDELCDMEVEYFMRNHIKREICICRKYRNPSSTNKCQLCSHSRLTQSRKFERSTRDGSRTPFARTQNRISVSPEKGHQGYKHNATSSTEISLCTRMKRKRKPKVIPAADYIATYYFPHLMKYENLKLPSRASLCESKRLLGGDTTDMTPINTSQRKAAVALMTSEKKLDVESDDTLASELSRIFI